MQNIKRGEGQLRKNRENFGENRNETTVYKEGLRLGVGPFQLPISLSLGLFLSLSHIIFSGFLNSSLNYGNVFLVYYRFFVSDL